MSSTLYEKVIADLSYKISNRILSPGQRIPSEKELCDQYEVSGITIKRAMKELSHRGLVVRRPKLGTFAANVAGAMGPQTDSKKMHSLVFIAPFMNDELESNVLHGLSLAASEENVRVQVETSLNNPAKEAEMLESLPQSGADGAVLMPIEGKTNIEKYFALKLKHSFPFVLVDLYFDGLEVPHVVTDDLDAGYRLTQILIEKGHRRIGFIGEDFSVVSVRQRYLGYAQAMRDHQIPANPYYVRLITPYVDIEGQERNFQPEIEGYRQMLSMMERPTAVVAANNYHAKTFIEVATEMKLRVPQDISVVGMGGWQTAARVHPPLTYMRQNFEQMGQEALVALQQLIENKSEIHHAIISAVLEEGQSVADISASSK
jgi:DNA-binding LacI/PurR family transcriptional regulator